MDEKRIERHLTEGVRGVGGLCLKFISPSMAGVPDRLIIMPNGRVVFAELKTEVGRLSKIQEYAISELKKRNADVRVLYGLRGVKEFLREVICDDV